MNPIVLIFINVALGVIGQFFIKKGMNLIGDTVAGSTFAFFFKAFTSPFVLGGLTLYGVSLLIWLVVLSKVNLSLAYPLISISYVLVLFVSWLFLNEAVPAMRWVGVGLIMAGVFFISRTA